MIPNSNPVTLSAVQAGITRLRVKGGASPESLYDLVNAHVTASRTIAPRPGSVPHATLPPGTKGLALYNGVFQVFADHAISGIPEGFNLNVLAAPTEGAQLVRIWKAEALLGGMYVAAEWSDDPSRAIHYWLQPAEPWEPNTVYLPGSIVTPTEPNGISYSANRATEPGTVWAPGVERTVGDVVEPTVFNGFEYEVIQAYGNPPRSGSTEPDWPAATNATVIEEEGVDPEPPPQAPPPPAPPPGYGNPGGSQPPNKDRGVVQIQ